MCTHNLCFRAKIRKNVYPCTLQFYYMKVGCKGVYITWKCSQKLHDVIPKLSFMRPTFQKTLEIPAKLLNFCMLENFAAINLKFIKRGQTIV